MIPGRLKSGAGRAGLIIAFLQLSTLLAALVPDKAAADVGVPMIFLGFPFMLLAFIPVCLLEILIFARKMHVPSKNLIKPVVLANLVSTIVGYPLSWALLLGLEFLTTGGSALGLSNLWRMAAAVTLQAAWLIPYESELRWMIPVAGMVGLVPAFFLSVWIEHWTLRKFPMGESKFQRDHVRLANLASYAFLYAILFAILSFNLFH